MKYKIIFFDLDGTLLNSEHAIAQKNINAIKKLIKSGFYAVPSSGRSDLAMQSIAKELGLFESGGYILCYNGGKIVKLPQNEVVFSQAFDLNIAQKAYDLAESLGLEPITFNKTSVVAKNTEKDVVIFEKNLTKLPLVQFDGNLKTINAPINKLLGAGDEQLVLKAQEVFKKQMPKHVDVFRSFPFFLEIVPAEINKGTGVKNLLKILNIKPEQAIACGDSDNDIPMFKSVGLSLAMANAKQYIKDITHDTIPTNDENGVAFAIEKYFGIKA